MAINYSLIAKLYYPEIKSKGDGLYAWLTPDDLSILKVENLLSDAPFKCENFTKLHLTVIHSRQLVNELLVPNDIVRQGLLTNLNVWKGHDGLLVLVALIDSVAINSLNYELMKQGLTSSYDDYNAHMTIATKFESNPEARLWIDSVNANLAKKPLVITFDKSLKGCSLN